MSGIPAPRLSGIQPVSTRLYSVGLHRLIWACLFSHAQTWTSSTPSYAPKTLSGARRSSRASRRCGRWARVEWRAAAWPFRVKWRAAACPVPSCSRSDLRPQCSPALVMWPPALFTRSLSCVRLHCTVVQTMTKDQKDELASAEKTLAWLQVGARCLAMLREQHGAMSSWLDIFLGSRLAAGGGGGGGYCFCCRWGFLVVLQVGGGCFVLL